MLSIDMERTEAAGWKFLRDSLLLCLFTGHSEAQCDGCVEYCCEGSPPFCCSYYAFMGDVLSGMWEEFRWRNARAVQVLMSKPSFMEELASVKWGTAISGIVFGVVFLMGALAAFFLCVCMCVKNGRGAQVDVFNTSYINTVSQGYPGPPPPYTYDYEMYPSAMRPPPYTPTPPRTDSYSPPPPYPGCNRK